jgi:hypothetical protein
LEKSQAQDETVWKKIKNEFIENDVHEKDEIIKAKKNKIPNKEI